MLEKAMGSSFSRGRREAKQLDEMNGTLVFHIVECSWQDLFQPEVIHTKLCQSIKMSALHSLQRRVTRKRLGIWYLHPFLSFIAHPDTEVISQHLIQQDFLSVQTEKGTETACLSGVGLADKILACHL